MGLKRNGTEKGRETPPPDAPDISYIKIVTDKMFLKLGGLNQQFRYATWIESFSTVMGVILGLLSALGICFNLLLFGELSTCFIERTAQQEATSSRLPLLEIFGGGRRLSNASHEENMKALLEDGRAFGIGMAVSILLSLLLCFLSVTCVNWSAYRQIKRIRLMFLKAVLRQDMSWYDTDKTFNLASRMTDDMSKLKEGMGEKMTVVANLAGTAIISIIEAFTLGWELTLACMVIVPFSITSSVLLSNYQTRSSVHEMDSYSQAGKQAEEVFKSVRTVVAFGGEQKEIDRYRRLLEPAERYGCKRGLYTGLGSGFNWILTYCINTIGLTYGTRLVIGDIAKPTDERRYVVGNIFSIIFCVYMATQSITISVPHGEAFSSAKAAAASIFKLMEREPLIDSLSDEGISPRRVKGEITLEDVHFSYPSRPDVKVLKGFSLHVKAGETVALVGSSGCGKSTILQLVQRLYDPFLGTVKLDGKNIKNLNLAWLRSSLGVVGQEPVLFRGTIHDNIALGAPECTREEVQRVAEMAYAHDFITHLPNGYETVIGERGASLSGGQKQRIAIARSLLREPAVLLLDEATSALDPHSERRVQAALDRASYGRTTLVVSHRPSTIVNADRIICLDQGVIVEQGTHKDLMANRGFFWKLVTTGTEEKDPDVIKTVLEEEDGVLAEELLDHAHLPRNDVKRHSKKIHRHNSMKKGVPEWMSPRDSISSVVSLGIHTFTNDNDCDSDTDKIEDEDIKPVNSWQLLKQNAPEWPLILIGSIAAAIQGACFPAFSVLLGLTVGVFAMTDYDEVTRRADLYSGLFVVVAAVAGVSMCLQSTSFTTAGLKMTSRLRLQYFSSLLKQEMGYYDKESNVVGALCSRLSGDAAAVQGATGIRIGLIVQGVSSVAIGFILGCSYNWKLTLVGAAFLPLMVGSIWFDGLVSQKSGSNEQKAMEAATAISTEAVVSIRTVQSLGVERAFLEKFKESLDTGVAALFKKTRWRGLVLGSGIYVPFISYSCAIVYGISLMAYEGVSYEVVLLVTQAIMYGAYMLGHALVYAPSFNSAKACGARILHTINRVPEIRTDDGVHDKKNWSASGKFSIQNVEFSYPTRPHVPVLRGLDLKVEAGKMVALVGSSGCGKSTVLQLLLRFYDPVSGNIELDGLDTRKAVTLPRLRRQLGVVQQEPILFDRTLGENIAYGDNSRKVTMHEIVSAAKAANIHSFIVSLPQGYETKLGSGGAQLSGGQKQRVCIARALIRSPRLLLLDEATSALDATSEKAVSEALEVAAKGRTCISIAHRLSTIKDADIICVVDKGKIVESGTHAELMNLKGHYWKMSHGQHLMA